MFCLTFLLGNIKTKVYSVIICVMYSVLTIIVDQVSDACIAEPKYADIMSEARKYEKLATNKPAAAELVSKLELELQSGKLNAELASQVLIVHLIQFDIY